MVLHGPSGVAARLGVEWSPCSARRIRSPLGTARDELCQRENMPHTICPNSFPEEQVPHVVKSHLDTKLCPQSYGWIIADLLLRWHCWAKCMRHEVLKSSWVWYKRTLDSSFFFSSLQRDVGVSHLFGGEIFSFWLIFFEKIKWKPTTLEFRNDHIQLCSFYCILKLFRDI